MKRVLFTAVFVLIIVGLLWYAFRPVPVDVELGVIERGSLRVTLDHEGKTRVKELHVIHAPLDGTLRRITLDPGDSVVAGVTQLAVIDPLAPALLDERAVASAEAQVHAAAAAVEQEEQRHRKALEQLRLASAEHERAQELFATEVGSRLRLETAERDLRLWEGEVSVASAGAKVARFQLALAEAALLRTRGRADIDGGAQPAHLVLKAPIDGRVFRVLRESEGPVSMGEALVELGDPKALEIVADYLSTDAVRMEPGMAASIEGWGGSGALAARVRLVEPSGFTKISALGVEEQRVNVVLDLVEPEENLPSLGDGFRVQVRVIEWEGHDVLTAPEGGLFRGTEGWALFAVVDGFARQVPVKIGHRNGLRAEVLDGVAAGAAVILHPTDSIADGVQVRERAQ